ncbi:MAG: hypothetical protein AAFU85_10615 [Planctomycetota bacterium]
MIRRSAPFAFCFLAILVVVLPMLGGQRVAFRDASHFYLPLYDYVAERTANEWLPLWNPLDHAGMPLVGESSTAVLYPVRYGVYSLPVQTATALNLYLIAHVLIASFAAIWLARRIGCAEIGATTAGLVYPLSGSVYGLCCNPPFLVGAAWLPLALGACLLNRPIARNVPIASFALAMMVLGGDPQTAFHVMLVTCSVASAGALRRLFSSQTVETTRFASSRQMLLNAGFAAAFAAALSCMQIAASLDWSRHSDRAASRVQRREAFEFSFPPWHLAEVLSARPFGEPFPRHRRLGVLIPGDGRMWTPSIYAGTVVGLALLLGLIQKRSAARSCWLWLASISMLLCFGHFGAVWVIQQVPGLLEDWDSAIGGPYWMLWSGVRGYSAFRYPAKWLPIFALAASMVTALWISTRPSKSETRISWGLAIVALLIGVVHQGMLLFEYQFASRHADEYWGPCDQRGGWWIARNGWLISATCFAALATVRGRAIQSRSVLALTLLLIAIDVGCSATRLLPLISVRQETELLSRLAVESPTHQRSLRTQSGSWPKTWQTTGSDSRAMEVAVGERASWLGRWHLADRRAVFNSTVSIRSRKVADFWNAFNKRRRSLNRAQQQQLWQSIGRWLGIDGNCHLDGSRTIEIDGMEFARVLRFRHGDSTFARAFTDWQPPRSMDEILASLAEGGIVLPSVAIEPPQLRGSAEPHVDVREPRVINVSSDNGCVLERCQLQDGHWTARLVSTDRQTTRRATVFPSSQLNQAVFVPAGQWVVHFEYRPWWKWPSVAVMATGWLLWLGLACRGRLQIRPGD